MYVIGSTIGRYKILERLGGGGMGEVFKAEDTTLGRPVALKFLAAHLLDDGEAKQRFLREAKAAAAISHPNICHVYEIGEEGGKTFLAMAYLEGEPLADHIAKGPSPLEKVLDIGRQVAEGLEAAQEKGIIHRDIKPANIIVDAKGHATILDFGLARLNEASKLTRADQTIGTAAYMSPEQSQGANVDRRTDIWALGCVLYEMVCGRRPFQGVYDQALLYEIVHEQPEPLTSLRTGVPMEIERIVGKCLAKNPDQRYQGCTDLLVDLKALQKSQEGTAQSAPSGFASSVATPALSSHKEGVHVLRAPASIVRRRRPILFALAVVLGFVLGAVSIALLRTASNGPSGGSQPATEYNLRRITWDGQLSGFPALSPDGRLLAYASDRSGRGDLDIWVQQVDGGSAIRLTDNPADELQPSFSPDGTRLVYFRMDSGIFLIPALGGDPYLVAEDAANPSFGPDGKTVAYRKRGKLYFSPVSMGEPVELMADFSAVGPQVWSPDGSHVLCHASRGGEPSDWWAAPIDGSEPKPLDARKAYREAGISFPYPEAWSWSLSGPLLGSDGELFRVPVDTGSWKVAGPPERLTFGSGLEALPSGSEDGKIAFMDVTQRRDVWSLALNPRTGGVAGDPVRLTRSEANDTSSVVSADSKRLVYISDRWGRTDLWTKDLETGKESNLSNDSARQRYPLLMADGERVAYLTRENGKPAIYVRPYGGGVGRRLCDDCGVPRSGSTDGRFLLYDRAESESVNVLDVETGDRRAALAGDGLRVSMGRVSRDGRWLACRVRGPGEAARLMVAPFRGMESIPREEWIEISSHASDTEPVWNHQGTIVYFISGRAGSFDIWMQRLEPEMKQPRGEPQIVKRFPRTRHSMGLMTAEDRRLSVSRDRLVFPMSELGSAVWLMEPVE